MGSWGFPTDVSATGHWVDGLFWLAAGLVHGFYWSILVIGTIPVLVLTVAGVAIWRSLRHR